MSAPLLSAHLHGTVGDFALDVALDLPTTGVTALFGRSGSGKTTLLRCIAGLERLPGMIRFQEDIWQNERHFVPPERRRVGYVFQGANLLPHMSVRKNLLYASRRSHGKRFPFETVVERTQIGALLDRMPAKLSGGESQRVAIARALLSEPRLLLMDEPLSALDSAAKQDLLAYLETLFADFAIPVIYVSHDRVEVERLANCIITLAQGRVTDSLYNCP